MGGRDATPLARIDAPRRGSSLRATFTNTAVESSVVRPNIGCWITAAVIEIFAVPSQRTRLEWAEINTRNELYL
ncbi:unnamed protein product, partial [Iphiclides podalirius]